MGLCRESSAEFVFGTGTRLGSNCTRKSESLVVPPEMTLIEKKGPLIPA